MDRKELLQLIIDLKETDSIKIFQKEIASFEWDTTEPLVRITLQDIYRNINKVLVGSIEFNNLLIWAELIESREDIEIDPTDEVKIKSILFKLANPEICGVKTKDDIKDIIEGR